MTAKFEDDRQAKTMNSTGPDDQKTLNKYSVDQYLVHTE